MAQTVLFGCKSIKKLTWGSIKSVRLIARAVISFQRGLATIQLNLAYQLREL